MTNKPTVSLQAYIRSGAVQQVIGESIGGDNAGNFTTSLLSVVNTNPVLQDCPPESIIKAAITAASMKLPIDPNLGFAYIIPYNNKVKTKEIRERKDGSEYEVTVENWQMVAQFQLGYKGFIQLAQRSGQFKRINATDVREGEYKGIDRRSGDLDIDFEQDETKRNKLKIVGYLGYFRLQNNFEKELYMSVEELNGHAKKYSKSFAKGYGLWSDQFDVMAKKTVLKLLISKYGALSTSLQKAVLADQSAVEEDGFKYVDNDKESIVDTSDEASGKGKSDKTNEIAEGEVVTPPNVGEDVTPPDAPDTTDEPATEEDEPSEPVETDKEKLARKIAESKARREAEKK